MNTVSHTWFYYPLVLELRSLENTYKNGLDLCTLEYSVCKIDEKQLESMNTITKAHVISSRPKVTIVHNHGPHDHHHL